MKRLRTRQCLVRVALIIFALSAVYLMVALMSFNPLDPSWIQTAWHEKVCNLGGIWGAWLAGLFFFVFGIPAYMIPVVIWITCWLSWTSDAFNKKDDVYICFLVAFKLTGALTLIISSCSLLAMHTDDFWYFGSGGVIGSLVSTSIIFFLNTRVGTTILLILWVMSLKNFMGYSWKSIAEKIGRTVLEVAFNVLQSRLERHLFSKKKMA